MKKVTQMKEEMKEEVRMVSTEQRRSMGHPSSFHEAFWRTSWTGKRTPPIPTSLKGFLLSCKKFYCSLIVAWKMCIMAIVEVLMVPKVLAVIEVTLNIMWEVVICLVFM